MSERLFHIDFASKADGERVQLFIAQHWKADHIYVKDTQFFLYDFDYPQRLNFVIAKNKENEIVGILGFIQYSESIKNADLFTVMWKVLPKSGDPQLGIRLLLFLKEKSGARSISTVGANPATLPIYNFLGYQTGQLKHYHIINQEIQQLKTIAKIPKQKKSIIKGPVKNLLVEVTEPAEVLKIFFSVTPTKTIPLKSKWFFEKRYLQHPYYTYRFFVVTDKKNVLALFVTREIKKEEYKVLRIVDFMGDENGLENIGGEFLKLIHEEKIEFVDFYQHGISSKTMKGSGFTLRTGRSGIVIPNYFEPFVAENVELNFFSTRKRNIRLYKGDGDQDRPGMSQYRNTI
jgi:hypothetical protein